MIGFVDPFTEAVRSLTQPCSLLVVAPIALVVAVSRGRWQALVAATIGAVVGGWALAGGWLSLSGFGLQLSAAVVVVVVLALGLAAASVQRDRRDRTDTPLERGLDRIERPASQAAGVGVVAFIATLWWRPCVGVELGGILTDSQESLTGELLPMAFYMIGLVAPAAAVALTFAAARLPYDVARVVSSGAAAACLIIAASVLVGQHDEVVVALTRWTLNE